MKYVHSNYFGTLIFYLNITVQAVRQMIHNMIGKSEYDINPLLSEKLPAVENKIF